jgi:sarcosine oxidase subunit beta
MGASIAYQLALAGAPDVVLCDRGEVAGGSTGRAMGGVRQQFATAAEVALARESIDFFEELGAPFFHQVGYLFLATSGAGLAALEDRVDLQEQLGVPVQWIEPGTVPGLAVDDVLGAAFGLRDGIADPPAVTREVVRRAAALGVEVREHVDAAAIAATAETAVIACGPWSAALGAELGVELPVRPLCRQLLLTAPVAEVPEHLPLVVECETGFHFRKRGDALVLAMNDPSPRWGFETEVDESVFDDRLERLARRFPPAAGTVVAEAWAGLYDMTADAHPIIGRVADGIYAACGFSGHGFMQSPAVGRALAQEILEGGSTFDLEPYRLDRFGDEPEFPETLVL